jgi:heptosyltransferase-1
MERVLIVRLGAMGDILHALPAVAALHAAQPDAEISWMVERRWQDLLPPWVLPVLVDTKLWRKQPLSVETRGALHMLRRHGRHDLAIDLQGATKSAVLGRIAGAEMFVGPADPREWPARFFYDAMIETDSAHVIDQAREIVGAAVDVASRPASTAGDAGVAPTECLPQTADGERWAQQFANDRIAILNPTAGWPAKQWPADRYGALAKKISARGFRILVNIGPGEEEVGAAAVEASGGTAETISCTIPQLIALTRHASLFVGGDTGPMHLAAMLGVPTVAIFGPTDPARNGPYYARTTIVRSPKSLTSYSHVDTPDPGLMLITAAEVMAAVEKVLA